MRGRAGGGGSIGEPSAAACLVPHNSQTSPQSDVAAKWSVSAPDAVKNFSAIAYWFGSKLQKELIVPVGVINNSFGGTQIQAWLPLAALQQGPWPRDKSYDFDLGKADYERRRAEK